MPQRESVGQTLLVAVVLCVVCSLLVSGAAVTLKPYQQRNQLLDRQRNVLDATGLAASELGKPASELSAKEVSQLYSRIRPAVVDLETGELRPDIDPATYDQQKARSQQDMSIPIVEPAFDIGVDRREKYSMVFFVVDEKTQSEIKQVVLPVYGKGLWSTLFGYLAVDADGQTIKGLTFYQHGETPGLGGEVENQMWKQQWQGRYLYGEEGTPAAGVAKGPAAEEDRHLVDGLSGATITSTGVTNLVRYWTSEEGFKPFLEKVAAGEISIENMESNDG